MAPPADSVTKASCGLPQRPLHASAGASPWPTTRPAWRKSRRSRRPTAAIRLGRAAPDDGNAFDTLGARDYENLSATPNRGQGGGGDCGTVRKIGSACLFPEAVDSQPPPSWIRSLLPEGTRNRPDRKSVV